MEEAIARHAVAATAARLALVDAAQRGAAAASTGGFPPARHGPACPIAERLAAAPALAVEDWLRAALAANRARAMRAAGTAALGAHRADMALADAATGLAAAARQHRAAEGAADRGRARPCRR